MTAETASEATTTSKRPRPLANTPFPTGAAYFCAHCSVAVLASPVFATRRCWHVDSPARPSETSRKRQPGKLTGCKVGAEICCRSADEKGALSGGKLELLLGGSHLVENRNSAAKLVAHVISRSHGVCLVAGDQ